MKERKNRRLPVALMALGALLLLVGLAMLSRTPGALQYGVAAPAPGEKGEAIRQTAAAAKAALEGMEESLSAAALGGVKATESLSAGEKSETVSLYAIGEGWLEVYPRFLTQGRRISETELRTGARVAMLDEGLAFKLFGTELPEDARVQLGGQDYQVVGTVRHAGSLLGGRGVGDVQPLDGYVPLLAAAADGVQLDVLTLSALPVNQTGAAQLFEDSARSRWQDGGTLVDLSKEAMRRTMLPRLLALIAGLYALAGLFRRMTACGAGWFAGFREALSQRYLKALLPRLFGIVLLTLLGYAALVGAAYLLMAFSARPLYVFTEWVPENIVEWSSITKVFWGLTGGAAGLVRVGSRELRVVEFWGGVVRWGTVLALLGAALRGRQAARQAPHDGR